MNAEQRKKIETIQGQVSDAQSVLETIKDENQSAYDNLPEGLQNSDKGEKFTEIIDILDEVISSLNDIEARLEDAIV